MKRFTPFLLITLVGFVGCATIQHDNAMKNDADTRQAAETKKRLAEADRQIGMPDITRFTERKLAKDILELRDKEITTYCYVMNMHGKLIFIGEAIGFGLPYSVQFTNPERLVDAEKQLGIGLFEDSSRVHAVSQADPNGLHMPGGLAATWIMLKGPDGKVHPVYMEPEIIVSPFPLHAHEVAADTHHVPTEVDHRTATEVHEHDFTTTD